MRIHSPSGINLFQLIYRLRADYETRTGESVLNLSLGNPDLLPPAEVLKLKSEWAGRAEYRLHTYGEDGDLEDFSRGFLRAVLGEAGWSRAADLGSRVLPSQGIKSVSAMIPFASGLTQRSRPWGFVVNEPAYDVVGTWGEVYGGGVRLPWRLRSEVGMTLETSELLLLGEKFRETHGEYPKLIFVIRPGNPSAKGAMRQDWEELAQVALKWRARLVNDGAYTTLARPGTHTPLSEVAPSIPELEWLELFSVSKALSDPGARLGVSIGSADFIEDLRIVKGNTDSGAVPHVMAAYGSLFRDQPLSARLLTEIREIYQKRVEILVPKLKACGFQEACETTAGFFTLWKMPKRVNQKSALEWQEYYQRVEDSRDGRKVSRAEAIHRAILDATGVLGVHFSGSEDLLRFAVCTDLQEESRVRGYWERLSRVEIG